MMVGYLILHTLYALTGFQAPSLLSLLPAFIYVLCGLLMGLWCLKALQQKQMPLRLASILILLAVSIILMTVALFFLKKSFATG